MSQGSDTSAADTGAGAPNTARAIARTARSTTGNRLPRRCVADRSTETSSVAVPLHYGTEAGGCGEGESAQRPPLTAAAVAGLQLGQGSVSRGPAGDAQAQGGLDARDRAVGVQRPLLVGLAVAVPDLHLGP